MKVYAYDHCSTCKKALSYLQSTGRDFQVIPIREQPPTKAELRTMLKVYEGKLAKLFNTSGQDYRALGLKDRLPDLSDGQALALLAGNGNLVKRPFVVLPEGGLVGFDQQAWDAAL